MALSTLAFTLLWFCGGGEDRIRPRAAAKAVAAGMGSGVTTCGTFGRAAASHVSAALGMAKLVYAGTTSLFFIWVMR